MSGASLPAWYDDGALIDVVCRAESAGVDIAELVKILQDQRYPESPRRRVQRIVETTLDRTENRRTAPQTTQPRQTDESPPSPPLSRLKETDIEYLSSREFARLLRVALERFGGTVEQLEKNSSAATQDPSVGHASPAAKLLRWDRHGESTVVIVVSQTESQLDEDAVEAIRQRFATLNVEADRAVLATNGIATDEARAAATDAAVHFSDRNELADLLELTRVTPAVYGEILERGENPTFEWDEAVEKLPEPPTDLTEIDPFDAEGASSGRRGPMSVTHAGEETPDTPSGSGREKVAFSAEGDSVDVDPGTLGQLQTAGSTATDDDDDAIDGLLSNLADRS